MKKHTSAYLLLFFLYIFATKNQAFASYYEGDTFQARQDILGMDANKRQSCIIPNGAITKIIAPLQRYNMIVVRSSSICVALVRLD